MIRSIRTVNVIFLIESTNAFPHSASHHEATEVRVWTTLQLRLIDIIEELRSSSQLIVITHQKRTMEIADALYGVWMRGDGVTQVIGQRLREAATV